MLVLGIETATEWCGVALWDDGGPVAARAFVNHMELSRRLVPTIQTLLAEEDRTVRSLSGIAVSLGPGSFTGLRIGVSTGKTLAQALNLPVAGVPTMDVLAFPYRSVLAAGTPLATVLPARRGQHYVQWHGEGAGRVQCLDDAAFHGAARAAAPALVLGDAACAGWGGWPEPPATAHRPDAMAVALLGHRRLSAGDSDDLMALTPLYVGRSAAEERRDALKGQP